MAQSLAHTKWMCKYHIVFTPKYRRKIIYNKYKASSVEILKDLCKWKGVEILEGNAQVDHIHLVVSIPPKMSVSSFMGYLKGKSAMMIFDRHANLKYKFGNRHFWSRGYYVSTVGLDKAKVRKYIQNQEINEAAEDRFDSDRIDFLGRSDYCHPHQDKHKGDFSYFHESSVRCFPYFFRALGIF